MRIALFQPDIAGNVGAVLRLGACFETPVDIIEPCGFPFSDRGLRRARMDYAAFGEHRRHADWTSFLSDTTGRLVLFTTRATMPFTSATFAPDDVLLFGSEGSGVPDTVRDAAALAVRIPLAPAARSLNVAIAAGIGLAEALRQTGGMPDQRSPDA